MKIIIVGLGKVGRSLAIELSGEDNDITVIDNQEEVVQELSSQYDVMGVIGNGASHSTQMEAGIESADLLIAVTGSDELNILCCLVAKKAGNCHTIARVRNPEYSMELGFIKEELGLAMVINPELAAAAEIAKVLQFPSAIEVNSFAKNKVHLMKFRVPENSVLDNMRIADFSAKKLAGVLICAVERGEELIIPDGNCVLRARDLVSVAGSMSNANEFFRQVGIVTNQVRSLMIVGGSALAYYLARMMLASGVKVKLLEKNMKRCEQLCELLPKATVVCGDGTDKKLLLEEDIQKYESFAALTNIDEENILLSLYARKTGCRKLITKINRIAFDEVIRELDLDTVIHPKDITSEQIIQYVRSMRNSLGSNVETMHKIIDGRAEALEFIIRSRSRVTDIPLQDLRMKKGILVVCISRRNKIFIPRGSDRILPGDSVIITTQHKGLNDIEDILAR